MKYAQYPIVKLPAGIQFSLYLISEELKSRKLFHALSEGGLDDCYFQPHLDSLILRSMDLDDDDETFSIYDRIIEKRSRKIEADNDSIMKQAFNVYTELMNEMKKSAAKKE